MNRTDLVGCESKSNAVTVRVEALMQCTESEK